MAPWLPLYYPWMAAALPPIAEVISHPITALAAKSDLIHNVRIGREGLTYASWQVAQQRGIPFVLTPVHHPRWVGWRYREYIKLYQQADAVIALTQAEAKVLHGLGVPENRIHVTGHGPVLAPQADSEDFRHRHRIAWPMVLFLGQHYPYKGFRQVLEATAAVWAQQPETQFVFGWPPRKRFRTRLYGVGRSAYSSLRSGFTLGKDRCPGRLRSALCALQPRELWRRLHRSLEL